MTNFRPTTTPATTFNTLESRCFGVEIETSHSPTHYAFKDTAFGAKDDCSVTGKEFYSAILNGDSGLAAVAAFCAKANEMGYRVNNNCGLHVHVDMRNESSEDMKAIALAFLLCEPAFQELVLQERVTSGYCQPHRSDAVDQINNIDSWEDFAYRSRKMMWINFSAYNNHTTFENRLHQGTLDADEIIAWVTINVRLVNWASKAGWRKVRNTLLLKTQAEKLEFLQAFQAVPV
jgi:hypothetical protein